MNTNNSNSAAVIRNPNTPIPGVKGWTYGQAVQELIDSGKPVDISIFPFAVAWLGRPVTAAEQTVETDVDDFELATGWTSQAALELALECQRERRLFGNRRTLRSRRSRRGRKTVH